MAGKLRNIQGIYLFIKTQAALVAGSMADFGLTTLLVETAVCWYITANIAGNIAGAAVQFLLSRNWVFSQNSQQKVAAQLVRFLIMWVGNIALAAAGVFLLTQYFHVYYLFSKLIISVFLGTTYMYIMSKKFVFV